MATYRLIKEVVQNRNTTWASTFDERAATSLFLLQFWVRGWRYLREWPQGVQFVYVVHGALEVGLGVVDGADGPGYWWKGATEALVHPGPVSQSIHLALHLPAEVAVGSVVQALHAVCV